MDNKALPTISDIRARNDSSNPSTAAAPASTSMVPSDSLSLVKSFKSAICVIPPKSHWQMIQSIRQQHDKHYHIWMPHINLLYPFILPFSSDTSNGTVLENLKHVTNHIQPFKLKFRELGYFSHGKKSSTVWLKPETEPVGVLIELENWLVGKSPAVDERPIEGDAGEKEQEPLGFPEFDDLIKIGSEGFRPHLSLGQFRGEKSAKEAIEKFSSIFVDDPIEFYVTEIYWITRKDYNDPFKIFARIGLGANSEIVIEEQNT